MTRAPLWIIGRGGLLGSHLENALQHHSKFQPWQPTQLSFTWDDYPSLSRQFQLSCEQFISAISERSCHRWAIAWTAGKGVVATSASVLCAETQNFQCFLNHMSSVLKTKCIAKRGLFFLASSAGGVYAGTTEQPVTEHSPCRPLSDYGRSKQTQEKLLEHWAGEFEHVSYLIGRITNLYGFAVNKSKPKGFIAHMARSIILQQPFHLYVGLDTIRDFIAAEDCASYIARCLDAVAVEKDAVRAAKIFASEQPTSLASVVSLFGRIVKRAPRFVCSPSRLGDHQPRQLHFRSQVWPHLTPPITPLSVGVFRTYQRQLELYLAGKDVAAGRDACRR